MNPGPRSFTAFLIRCGSCATSSARVMRSARVIRETFWERLSAPPEVGPGIVTSHTFGKRTHVECRGIEPWRNLVPCERHRDRCPWPSPDAVRRNDRLAVRVAHRVGEHAPTAPRLGELHGDELGL